MNSDIDDYPDETATQHFQRTLGKVPEVIAALDANAPTFLEYYVKMRKHILADKPDGLDLSIKELIYVLLDVVYDNEPGALNHLHAALDAGLHPTALLDGLLQTLTVGGIQTWGKTGHRVYLEAIAAHEARSS